MYRLACFLLLLTACFSPCIRAQGKAPATGSAAVAPSSGPRLEFLDEVSFYEQRFLRLAEAIPAEKYSWRPTEGVRSIGEVYMHVAAGNYNFAKMLGTPVPAGVDPKAMVAAANDKAKVIQGLKDSFAHFRQAVANVKDSELEREQKTPRGQTTVRGSFFLIAGHYGEHLGQSVAYARQIGVVPPWTEERQRQEAEKPKP